MTAPKRKAQMSVYLDPDVMKALSAFAARREQSLSLIAEAAIASFLSPDSDERREAAIAKRLDQIDRRIARLERDVGISVETIALFILGLTPGLGLKMPRWFFKPEHGEGILKEKLLRTFWDTVLDDVMTAD